MSSSTLDLNAPDAPTIHGTVDNGALSSAPDSPSFDSPSTPSPPRDPIAVNINVSLEYPERESDVRHEPLPMELDKQISTSADLVTSSELQDRLPTRNTVPIKSEDPQGDAQMEEAVVDIMPVNRMRNGHTNGFFSSMSENSPGSPSSHSVPVSEPPPSSMLSMDSTQASADHNDQPPPAKRARKLSDAEQASLAHSALRDLTVNDSTAGYRSTTPTPATERKSSTLSQQQHRFCVSTIRQLKKLKDASPFLAPVDPIALNIPHYPSIIKHPMDFSAIERKLTSSNPVKPDTNMNNPRYQNADEFVADVRLVFSNALTFNGPDHLVAQMGKRVEAVFDKSIKQMPPPAEEPKIPIKKISPPPPPIKASSPLPSIDQAKKNPRRPSTSVPTIRRSETENARPKREIHPPPPKDLPYADAPKKIRRTSKGKHTESSAEQLKFCTKMLADLNKKQYWNIASPFYDPVDWVKLDIPSYPKVIKRPMDLGTMRKKLDAKDYPNAAKFYDDFKLMIKNCKTFNPVGTPVHNAGVELERVFNDKWAALPPIREVTDDDEDEDEEESDDEHARTIAMMESQIESMRGTVAALKNKKGKKEKEKKRDKHASPPRTSSSKVNGKVSKAVPGGRKKSKKLVADDDVLSFEQKKDLSITIQKLDGEKLEKVISIIHEGVPEIRDSTEEIELDIDSLPAKVLTKLYNFVLRPLRSENPKRNRSGTGTGTGGLKRKSMDEDVEAEKIRVLEERIRLFDDPTGPPVVAARDDDSVHSSDESSSDSSGSDSD